MKKYYLPCTECGEKHEVSEEFKDWDGLDCCPTAFTDEEEMR